MYGAGEICLPTIETAYIKHYVKVSDYYSVESLFPMELYSVDTEKVG